MNALRAFFLVTASSAIKVSSSARMCLSGTALGPSERAFCGSGWVSMNRPATPTATAARASTGTISRWPPLLYLIRHAQTVMNNERRFSGVLDCEIDDTGYKQLKLLREKMK